MTKTLDRRTANVIAAALLAVAVVAYTWATWQYFTKPVPGGNDFLARYTAFTAYFRLGLNPYSEAATLYTQQAIYGRAALPGEDLQRLTYPFYSVLVFGPFIVLDYAVARAIWMTLLHGLIVAANRTAPPQLDNSSVLMLAGGLIAGLALWIALLLRRFSRIPQV